MKSIVNNPDEHKEHDHFAQQRTNELSKELMEIEISLRKPESSLISIDNSFENAYKEKDNKSHQKSHSLSKELASIRKSIKRKKKAPSGESQMQGVLTS